MISCASLSWEMVLTTDTVSSKFTVSIYVRLRTFWTPLVCTAVAPSLSLDQRHGTCSKTICMSRTYKLTVFVVHWRRVFLISAGHIEHIRGVFATMCYINWHLHYITKYQNNGNFSFNVSFTNSAVFTADLFFPAAYENFRVKDYY